MLGSEGWLPIRQVLVAEAAMPLFRFASRVELPARYARTMGLAWALADLPKGIFWDASVQAYPASLLVTHVEERKGEGRKENQMMATDEAG